MTEVTHSLRFTPKFFIDPEEFKKRPISFIEKLYENNKWNLIIVEEVASNVHYHCLITTTISINTIRSRIKKYISSKSNYCLKNQKQEEEELEKAYRYVYKGENINQLPKTHQSFHTLEEIKEFHDKYWELNEKLKDTTTNVEKCYQYLKSTFGDKLPSMSRPMIATEITLSRMRKQKPPMPRHSLITFLEYIEFRIKEEYSGQDPYKTILDYFTYTINI